MDYSNPKIPEEINYSKENPLKEFALLLVAILGLFGLFVIGVHFFAQQFAHHIPFEYEEKIMPDLPFAELSSSSLEIEATETAAKKQAYLTKLANQLAAQMSLPEGMHINVNYINQTTINAAASLNGQIYIFQGLLDFVESENELAMIIAHEIAHIKARHPIKSLSSGVIVGLTVAIITGSVNNSSASSLLASGSSITQLRFSRKQETEADKLAVNALYKHYGHTNGSTDFFKRISLGNSFAPYLEFISTHPAGETRVNKIRDIETQLGTMGNGELKAMPSFLKS